MPFIPAERCAMLELVFTYDGQICENTLYFVDDVGWTVLKMNSLAAALKTWWDTNIKANVPPTLSLDLIRVTDLTTQTSPGIEYSTGLPLAGTSGGAQLPNNVTGSVTFLTDQRGRSFRGRNYVLGLMEVQVTGNLLSSGIVAVWEAAYEDLIALAVTLDHVWVVLSRFSLKAPRAAGVMTPVTGARMNNVVDSQRRRLPGRGQ